MASLALLPRHQLCVNSSLQTGHSGGQHVRTHSLTVRKPSCVTTLRRHTTRTHPYFVLSGLRHTSSIGCVFFPTHTPNGSQTTSDQGHCGVKLLCRVLFVHRLGFPFKSLPSHFSRNRLLKNEPQAGGDNVHHPTNTHFSPSVFELFCYTLCTLDCVMGFAGFFIPFPRGTDSRMNQAVTHLPSQ